MTSVAPRRRAAAATLTAFSLVERAVASAMSCVSPPFQARRISSASELWPRLRDQPDSRTASPSAASPSACWSRCAHSSWRPRVRQFE